MAVAKPPLMRSSHRRVMPAAWAPPSRSSSACAPPGPPTTYDDPDYLAHELDNVTRSLGPGSRQLTAATDPAQLRDPPGRRHGRVAVQPRHAGGRPARRPRVRHPRGPPARRHGRRSADLRRHAADRGRLRVPHRGRAARAAVVGRPPRAAPRHRHHQRLDPVARRSATTGPPSRWPPPATSSSPGTHRGRASPRSSATPPAIRCRPSTASRSSRRRTSSTAPSTPSASCSPRRPMQYLPGTVDGDGRRRPPIRPHRRRAVLGNPLWSVLDATRLGSPATASGPAR